ncbi:hypothetical protein [Carnobacterium pleistocenium]|uniref:hypothetical protein n=1 Tax=Carnobacterium pleistocenium TaxID=181073 RepID=UPI000558EDA7|nr:hypothetical protein [Carnobacterium pleistocenium]
MASRANPSIPEEISFKTPLPFLSNRYEAMIFSVDRFYFEASKSFDLEPINCGFGILKNKGGIQNEEKINEFLDSCNRNSLLSNL